MSKKYLLFFLVIILLNACGGSTVTQSTGKINRNMIIALSPTGGIMAEAIGIELFNKGFDIIDTKQISDLLIKWNITEIEITEPQNLSLLKDEGIDALLYVRTIEGHDNKPQSVSVRINDTHTGKIIAGLSWRNGWGGQEGSIMDRQMRKDISQAATEIVSSLIY